jgi:NAD-dependent deacetylase
MKIYIISGAGISAESGISTFRDKDGLWGKHDVDEVCNIRTWRKNYDLVHDFYNQRRAGLASVEPNKAHHLVADLQKRLGKDNVINITTNVDDLFERAGVEDTLYLHGQLTKMVNTSTGEEWDIGYEEYDKGDESKVVKPGVIFFGEYAPAYEDINSIRYFDMSAEDLIVFIGMSFLVCPVNMFLPDKDNIKTFNINLDGMTNCQDSFTKCYNVSASQGLEQFIKEQL